MIEYQLPVLMTASVSTRGMKDASFCDKEREIMYISALQYYASTFLSKSNKIVFVENSGWELNRIKKSITADKQTNIEFISLPPELFDISKGKGYNELLLINLAIDKSKFIKDCGKFFKVTGRYPIYNIGYFLKCATKALYKNHFDFYGDMKDHKIYEFLNLDWSGHSGEARLYASTVEWYLEHIGNHYHKLNDYEGNLVENLLFKEMKKCSNISKRFRREPHFGGMEGSNIQALSFTKNQDSLKGKVKRFIGNTIRLIFPFIWF